MTSETQASLDLVTGAAYAVMIACGALALWAGIWALRNRAVILKQLIAAGIVVAMLLVQAVGAVVRVVGGHELAEPAVFWGYIVVAVLVLPAGAVVAIAERTRWSSVALVVLSLALVVMQLRVIQLWSMGHA